MPGLPRSLRYRQSAGLKRAVWYTQVHLQPTRQASRCVCVRASRFLTESGMTEEEE